MTICNDKAHAKTMDHITCRSGKSEFACSNHSKFTRSFAKYLYSETLKHSTSQKIFIALQLTDLHDPWLMKDMDKAVDRIITAIENHEKILVYGDYDVDGTTSVACMYRFFENFIPILIFIFRIVTGRDME